MSSCTRGFSFQHRKALQPPKVVITRKPFPQIGLARYPWYHAIMIMGFADSGSEDVFNGRNTSAARRTCPRSLWSVAFRKLDQLDSATEMSDLAIPRRNRLETLKGDRQGQRSVRINDQYRICFRWTEAGPADVVIVDYH